MGRRTFFEFQIGVPAIILLVTLAFSPADSHAQTYADVAFGMSQAALSSTHQPWAIGPTVDFGVLVRANERFRYRFGVSWRRMWDDTVSASTFKLPRPGSRAEQVWTTAILSAVVERSLKPDWAAAPYFGAGLGIALWNIEEYPGNRTISVLDGEGQRRDFSGHELITRFVFGFEPQVHSKMRLRTQIGIDLLTGLGTNFSDLVNDERSRMQMTISVGLSIPFGSTRPPAPPRWRLPMDYTPIAWSKASIWTPIHTVVLPAVDMDRDGVADYLDECPQTPQGALTNELGCPNDADGDGVFDGLDMCSQTPLKDRATIDRYGCALFWPVSVTASVRYDWKHTTVRPFYHLAQSADSRLAISVDSVQRTSTDLHDEYVGRDSLDIGGPMIAGTDGFDSGDSDGDGVPDSDDYCPRTPHGLRVDRNGCLIMTELSRRLILHVSYVPGTSNPDWLSLRVLDDLIIRLKRAPHVYATVEGFTDNIGDSSVNQKLSQKRADKVRNYMIGHGIDTKRVVALGRGEVRFIANNSTATGRQRNRRIEISFHRP